MGARYVIITLLAVGLSAAAFAVDGSAGLSVSDREAATVYGGACVNVESKSCGEQGQNGCNGTSGYKKGTDADIMDDSKTTPCGGTCGSVIKLNNGCKKSSIGIDISRQ